MSANQSGEIKHCLFMAYDFPPCRAIGGALRSAYFAKYLPEFGWQPMVVALAEEQSVVEQYPGVTRVASLTPYKRPYEVTPYGWALNVYRLLRRMFKSRQVDLIYVSCPPFPQAVAALLLKRFFSCPLVVDFRDAWSMDPYVEGSRLKGFLYKNIFPYVEKIVLEAAEKFIANTPSMYDAYLEQYPVLDGKIVLIPNGYDEDDFKEHGDSPSGNKVFTLLYCGRFGIGGRDPWLLLEAIKRFVATKGNVLRLLVVGEADLLRASVDRMGLADIFDFAGVLPHDQAVSLMFDADVLLLYQEKSEARVSAVAGKTYEYLRAGRPIWAILPPGDNLDIIKRFAGRYELVSDYKIESMVQSLQTLYWDWEKGLLAEPLVISKDYGEQYNRRALSEKLVQVFNSLV
ncbi:MAG: glycosyltransferase family 4 protein [Desulfobulbaceae bacterium]|nr:glycosyltransferase family 4 protein [Desulfobulbaceae bacterium]